jgi:hypothetical protein
MGAFLVTMGATGIVFTMFKQANPGLAIMIGFFAGSLAVGVGIGVGVRNSNVDSGANAVEEK